MNVKLRIPVATSTTAATYKSTPHDEIAAILQRAHDYAECHHLEFNGSLSPQDAWYLVDHDQAILVDIRTAEERKFVGYVKKSLHIAWATGTAFNRNPRFLKELERQVGKDQTIILLCRSGQRSTLAAEAAAEVGFKHIYHVLEGFEGELNTSSQRNRLQGWKLHDLPWEQD